MCCSIYDQYEFTLIIIHTLADSEVLKYLDLSWNHIRGKGAIAIAAGLKVCPRIAWSALLTQVLKLTTKLV